MADRADDSSPGPGVPAVRAVPFEATSDAAPTAASSIALLGFVGAGKTTYVVAFYVACENRIDGMEITKYLGNRDYLNRLAEDLAACKPTERTQQTDSGELRLSLRFGPGAPQQELVIPDLSGELLRDSMASRRLDETLDQAIQSGDALLVFINTSNIVPTETIADFKAALTLAGYEVSGEAAPERPEDWEVRLAATQVQVLDALQEIVRRREGRPMRTVLILSAWDKQTDTKATPRKWAEDNLALLVQFLEGRPEVDWTVFGVSAQGGDFTNEQDVARLMETDFPQRARVERDDGQPAGIGAPLRWAFRMDP